mgnify:CR=1 FL=1
MLPIIPVSHHFMPKMACLGKRMKNKSLKSMLEMFLHIKQAHKIITIKTYLFKQTIFLIFLVRIKSGLLLHFHCMLSIVSFNLKAISFDLSVSFQYNAIDFYLLLACFCHRITKPNNWSLFQLLQNW